MDTPEIEKFTIWRYLKDTPLTFYPMLVIVGIALMNIFFNLDPLVRDGLRMLMYIAFGFQWIGIAQNYEKHKIQRMQKRQRM